MNHPFSRHRARSAAGGFLLLEVVLAVAIFALGVIALGRCMTDCLEVQQDRQQSIRARLALENRMAEIQASPALPDEFKRRKLEGMFTGVSTVERRRTLDLKSENNVGLSGLCEMNLTAEWTTAGSPQTQTLSFYLLRGN